MHEEGGWMGGNGILRGDRRGENARTGGGGKEGI